MSEYLSVCVPGFKGVLISPNAILTANADSGAHFRAMGDVLAFRRPPMQDEQRAIDDAVWLWAVGGFAAMVFCEAWFALAADGFESAISANRV